MPNTDEATTGNSYGASATRTIRGNRSYPSDLPFVIQQLDGFGAQFQRLQRKVNQGPNEGAHQELALLKRSILDQLLGLVQRIFPILIEWEFWHPGLSTQFHRLFLFDQPELNQGPATWLAYLGRLRSLLVETIQTAPSRTTGATGRNRDDSLENGAPAAPPRRDPCVPIGGASERHFTPRELAAVWGLDQSTIRRLFHDEEGVLRIPHLRRRGKRDYVSLRIPESVAARVHERRSRSLFKI